MPSVPLILYLGEVDVNEALLLKSANTELVLGRVGVPGLMRVENLDGAYAPVMPLRP